MELAPSLPKILMPVESKSSPFPLNSGFGAEAAALATLDFDAIIYFFIYFYFLSYAPRKASFAIYRLVSGSCMQ